MDIYISVLISLDESVETYKKERKKTFLSGIYNFFSFCSHWVQSDGDNSIHWGDSWAWAKDSASMTLFCTSVRR